MAQHQKIPPKTSNEPKYIALGRILMNILDPGWLWDPFSFIDGVIEGPKGNLYFQPPRGRQMKYPCIVFNLSTGDTQYADNAPYIYKDRWQVQFISKKPDEEEIHHKITKLPMCVFSRFFVADNLNHWNYDIYY